MNHPIEWDEKTNGLRNSGVCRNAIEGYGSQPGAWYYIQEVKAMDKAAETNGYR
jgi:hypothetical protein